VNKIHNIIWSTTQNAWIVVAEGTKRSAKSGAKALNVMIALILLSPAGASAATLPQGGVISVGQGTIVNNGSNQLVIKQTTDKLGVNWQSFNVGADGQVIFTQPSKESIALNRVVGSDGSAILGKIDANGQVFLINPNGVIFGKDAQVNVGGLVASTMNITDEKFKNGDYSFTADGGKNGEVINLGQLQAADGGYVALLGKSVKNNGIIKAKLGTAAMAAGDAVTLDFAGDGLVNIQVKQSSVNALVENKGLIKTDGGSVLMTARASNALLNTVVNNEGVIEAQTIGSRGGKIFLDGGMEGGTLEVAGTLDASAPTTGDGGFIETSAKNVKIAADTRVTTLSKAGKTGLWLVDPQDFTIYGGNDPLSSFGIGVDTLVSNLSSTNVALETSSAFGWGGKMTLYGDLSWSADTTLTLTAHTGIELYGNINVNGANGGLALNYGADPRSNAQTIGFFGHTINLNGANSTFALNGENYQVIRNLADLQNWNTGSVSGNYVIGNNINAASSNSWDGGLGYKPMGTLVNPFTGVLLGLGHSITDLTINRGSDAGIGLIGYATGASVRSLKLSGNVLGGNNTALLAGSFKEGYLSDLALSGTVNGGTNSGGIAGYLSGSVVNFVDVKSNVSGTSNVGGLVGQSAGGSTAPTTINNLSDSSFQGDVKATGNNVGGAVGVSDSTKVAQVKASGTVEGVNEIGGLIGNASSTTINKAYSASTVKGGYNVGGLLGKGYGSTISMVYTTGDVSGQNYAAGLIGTDDGGTTIDQAFSLSNVKTNGYGAGLIVDMSGTTITNSYSSGSISAISGALDPTKVGGFAYNALNANLDRVYSTTFADGGSGFISHSTGGTIQNAVWDIDLTGSAISAVGVGKTNLEMRSAATFAGWGADTIGSDRTALWRIYDGKSVPLLTFMMPYGSSPGSVISTTYQGRTLTSADIVVPSFGYGSDTFFYRAIAGTGLIGGDTSGGSAIRNAGTYTLDSFYSNQMGMNFDQQGDFTLTVNKKDLSATGTGVNKVYDGSNLADINFTSDAIAGDDVVLSALATFDDKNAGTGKTVTISGATLGGADAGNYNIVSLPTTATADINKAILNVTATGGNKVYDGTVAASVTLSDNHFGADDVVVGSTGVTFSDKNAGTGKVVSITGINVTGVDADNYIWNTTASTTANITKAALNVTAAGVSKTYDGTTVAGASLNDNRISGDSLVVSAGSKNFTDKNAGTGKTITVGGITVTGADASNYVWNATTTTTADIAKAALAVTAIGTNKTYDGNTNAGATLSDNRLGTDALVLGYSSGSFANKNAGAGKTVTVSGITVTGSDASNYTWNTSSVTTADIAKKALNVTATGVSRAYDGTTSAGSTLSDDRIGSDVLVLGAASNAFADKNAGTGKTVTISGITVTGADAGNYVWNTSTSTSADITKAALTVSASGINKTYDGTTDANANLSDNRIGADDLTLTSSGESFADKNAGVGKTITVTGINVTGADAANYTWNTTASTAANIAKAALNVTATGVNKTYDTTTNADASLADNRIGSDVLTVSATSKNFSGKNAGLNRTITVTGITVTGTDASNYTWNTTAVTSADIAKAALNVTATAANRAYDGTTNAGSTLGDDRLGSDVLTLSAGSSTFSDKNAGTGKTVTVSGINVTGADASNYTWNASTTSSADITKAALTVSASGLDKTYDGSTNASTTLSDNRIGSDVLVVSAGSSAFTDKNAGAGKLVSVNGITVSGADAANYTWNSSAVTSANVAKAALTVTATGVDKTYDGTMTAGITLGDNRFGADVLTVSSAAATFANKNVGVGKALNVTGINVTGTDAGNYTFNTTAATTADITKAALTVTASGVGKTYDGTTVASASLSDDRIGSDVLIIGSGAKSFSDKNAGVGKSINVAGITVTGADAGNYVWNTTATTTADIAKAALNVTASGVNRTYDGTTNASSTLSDDRIGTDVLALTAGSSTFADKNAGTGKTVSVSGISVTGVDAVNYVWNTSTTTSADIAKAGLTVSAVGANKVYDGTTAANANLSDNHLGADNLVLSSSSQSFADKNAGVGKLITVNGINVTGVDAGNYTWNTTASTTADVAKAALSITAAGVNKTYDGSTAAAANLSDNRIASDDLVVSSAGKNFADKNVGLGKTVSVNGISVAGADAANYTWNTSTTTTADIAKAALNVTAAGANKSYDGTTVAGLTFADNRVAGDTLSVSGLGSFADTNAGTGKSISVSGINVTGADAGNYTWNTLAVTAADIAQANLTVKAINGSKTEGDTDGVLNWSLQSGSLFGSDSINGALARDVGEVSGQYAINKGTLDAGANYNLAFVAGTYDITAPPVVTPPVVTPPVVTPPVVTPPVVTPPVVTPPVVVDPITPPVVTPPVIVEPPVVTPPTSPVVNAQLQQAKEVISTISAATKVSHSTEQPLKEVRTDTNGGIGDYRLTNFGMKLPEDSATGDNSDQ
jgi:filamentous hemagglutinin family protein